MTIRACCGAFVSSLLWLALAPPAWAGLAIEVEVTVPTPVIEVGQPLTIRMQVRNSGVEALAPPLLIYSDDFVLTYYPGMQNDGCHVEVSVPNPLPGPELPPLFGYTWFTDGIAPGEVISCEITFPNTLIPGTETIRLFSSYMGASRVETEFTYTLRPRGGSLPAVPVSAGGPWSWMALMVLVCITAMGSRVSRVR